MTTFNNREKAFEGKFAHDEALKFKAEARRNKLLGLWAAEKLGADDADAYAKEVVRSDFEEPGHEDVFRKIRGDFDKAGLSVTDNEIREHMTSLMQTAIDQVNAGV